VPFFIATAVNIVINWIGDRALSVHAVRSGMRRYLVALCLFLTAAGLVIPYVQSPDGHHHTGFDHGFVRKYRSCDQRHADE
jgi:hypothetical protein